MSDSSVLEISYLDTLPQEWDVDLLADIKQKFSQADYKIIILDDDPTGTQTARDLPVLTHWSIEALEDELLSPYPAFFILTNSRSLPPSQAVELAKEIGINIKNASKKSGVRAVIISRSDSTLRGHFPAEVDACAEALGKVDLPYLIIPFFLEGGRYTINDVHYVQEGDKLLPAAQTPFARDAAFGFTQSNLKKWVEEKTSGKVREEDVSSISIEDIRTGGPNKVAQILDEIGAGKACIVNAVSYRDMEVVVSGLQMVEGRGKEFLYRTAASFVRTRTGLNQHGGLLSKDDLISDSQYGGLFVIGSYVEKTSNQIQVLFEQTDIKPIQIEVEALLHSSTRDEEILNVTEAVTGVLLEGRDVALFTSRKLITGGDVAASLEIGQLVSDSIIRIIKGITVQPRYLVAKGGITSSDVATEGLGVRRAMVIGQAQPGVPAWRLGKETRYPGMSYIIFPGNVGDNDALAKIQQNLKKYD